MIEVQTHTRVRAGMHMHLIVLKLIMVFSARMATLGSPS